MTVTAGNIKDLPPGSMKAVQDGDREVLLVNLDNRIFAMNNRCTHRGCGLSRGRLEGETVRCPCHGSIFNIRTGEVVNGPAKIPEPVLAVTVRDGTILLAL
jgi:nitrite reductase/ring-hydroxylating ferredoxin subunit